MNRFKKIISYLLALLMVVSPLMSGLATVNALDNEKVLSLTTEKSTIKTGEKTTVNAVTNLPNDAIITSFEWASDHEEVAIVSGEANSATVEGITNGKAKITATVNYDVKVIDKEINQEVVLNESEETTLEITVSNNEKQKEVNQETTVSSNTNISESKPVKTSEKSDDKLSDDSYDILAENYIREHIDTNYAKMNKMELVNGILIKQTLVDANKIEENETIDSFFAKDEQTVAEGLYTMVTGMTGVYNVDDNSDYYVSYVNTMQNDKNTTLKDYCFAVMNTNGEIVKEAILDMNTGLAYIPKKATQTNGCEEILKLQVQMMQAIGKRIDKTKSNVDFSTTEGGEDARIGDGNVNILDLQTKVKTDKNLSKSELTVSVNGIPLDDENYDYNRKTGVVTINESSSAVSSVSVDVNEKSAISKLADRVLNIQDVYATITDGAGRPVDSAGKLKLPDSVRENDVYTFNLRTIYANDINNLFSNMARPYGFNTGDGPGGKYLVDKVTSGGKVTTPIIPETLLDGVTPRDVNIAINASGLTGWQWRSTGKSEWIPLRCCHTSSPVGVSNGDDKVRTVYFRILNLYEDDVLVGICTPTIYGQTGCSFIRFEIEPKKGNLNITKTNGNPSLTEGNDCYSLAGAEYQLRDGNGNVAATLTTDVNGNASVAGIKAGTYTLVETKASKGFELNSEHTSVTINAGQTTTLKGVGCLVEEPANDPATIEIKKVDMNSGECLPQGNATLEGAEFTIKYYNALYDKVSDLPQKATRTWVLKTKAISNGVVTKYIATLRNEYKVSGDDFYYTDNNPNPTLPVGTMTIQETKAPNGYLLDGAILSDNDGNTSNVDNGVFITQIKQDGSGGVAKVVAGNFPIVKDEVKKQHIEIEKIALDHNGKSTPLNGAEFTIKLKSDVDANGWDKAKTYDVITTKTIDGEAGQGVSKDLPYGEYILRETKTPAGYVQADDTIFVIEADSSETIVVQHIMVTDKETHIRLYKYDVETKAPLRQAEYLIFNETTNKEVGRYKTNDDGIIDLYKLEGGNSYYAQEITAPNGYKINDTKFYFDIDDNGFVHVSDKNSNENKDVFTIKDKGDMEISLSNKLTWFKLNINKTNDVRRKLADAEFTLYKDKDCTQEVMKGSTDNNGYLRFEKVEVGTYYLKETKAPAGYRKLLEPIKIEMKFMNNKHTFVVNDVPITSNFGDYSMFIENDWLVGNVTIINNRGSKLPETGSMGTMLLVGAGIGLCLLGLYQRKKKLNKGE